MHIIQPQWPAPKSIRAASSTCSGGVSRSPYQSLNLGLHVGDQQSTVLQNRSQLAEYLELPSEPMWLQQTHSVNVVDNLTYKSMIEADGTYSNFANQVCVVMTADCLPLLLCNRQGTEVAAVHAGWRGMADGIIEAAVDKFNSPADDILAWIGPCISACAFEVGLEVKNQLQGPESAYRPHGDPSKVYASLPELAQNRLQAVGVNACFDSAECTYSNADRFFSYRRDGITGRMATLIWIAD